MILHIFLNKNKILRKQKKLVIYTATIISHMKVVVIDIKIYQLKNILVKINHT